MENKAIDLDLLESSSVHLVIASYTKGTNDALDKANADAALAKKILFDDANWATKNGGYKETPSTAVLASGVITLTMPHTWQSAGEKNIVPYVYYKGVRVPHVGTGGTDGITSWDGVTAKTIVVDNAGGAYGTTVGDWEVTLLGVVNPFGSLNAIDAGGVSLPYTTTNIKSLGFAQPTFTKITKDGIQVTGNFTYWEVANRIMNGATLWNAPGEDLLASLYGTAWNAGAQNELTYLTNPFAISIIQFAENKLVGGGANRVFAIEERIYGCELNNIPNTQNRTAAATEPLVRQYDFTAKHVYRRVRRTGS